LKAYCFEILDVQEIFRQSTTCTEKSLGCTWYTTSALWYFGRNAGTGAARANLRAHGRADGRMSQNWRIDSKS
jgi:hypothetical protein